MSCPASQSTGTIFLTCAACATANIHRTREVVLVQERDRFRTDVRTPVCSVADIHHHAAV